MSQIIPKAKNVEPEKYYWKSFEALSETDNFKEQVGREFPIGASELRDEMSRRDFFKLMGASAGLAGVSGCIRRPAQNILPYGQAPEQIIPGRSLYYATAMHVGLDAVGLLVESHEGRPTKIEGNPFHPMSVGKTGVYHQSSVLDLYDPERHSKIMKDGKFSNLSAFKESLNGSLKYYRTNQGRGLYVLAPILPSRTITDLKKKLKQSLPQSTWYQFEPIHYDNVIEGVRAITGEKRIPYFKSVSKANIILSLESDFLAQGSGYVKSASEYAKNREPSSDAESNKKLNRLYVIENTLSSTGAVADHRASIHSRNIVYVLACIISNLYNKEGKFAYRIPGEVISEIKGLAGTGKELIDIKWIDALCGDLLKNQGKSLVCAGNHQSSEVHGLVYLLNQALGNIGKTVVYVSPLSYSLSSSLANIRKLAKDIKKGKVKDLYILGGNPVYSAPVDLKLGDLLKEVNVIHLSDRPNETSEIANWVIPQKHYLESWGDLVSIDGTASVVQPLVEPLYESLSDLELLAILVESKHSAYELVQKSYNSTVKTWRKWLHNGIISRDNVRDGKLALNDKGLASKLRKAFNLYEKETVEVSFLVDYSLYDGRFNNNGWLQELPDPITKMTWDNAALLSPSFAKEIKVRTGEFINIKHGNNSIDIPVLILPGIARKSIAISQGYGSTNSGSIGRGVGFSIAALRTANNFDSIINAKVTKIKGRYDLANVQDHWSLSTPSRGFQQEGEPRPLYLETTQKIYEQGFDVLKNQAGFNRLMKVKANGKDVAFGSADLKSLWKEREYNEEMAPNQWGMTIDLGKCTGCNVCTIACQAENNIPIVGKEQVLNGREMHWIRIDRYFEGSHSHDANGTSSEDSFKVALQPVTCHQCENAPCEQVCPVAATTHSSEGLNDMAYNRCIGTRYCSNNCPYKVRRFNFFDFHQKNPQSVPKKRNHLFDYVREPAKTVQMQFNPDVTVRMRGVMEKCTFCVQRINEAKIIAKNENRELEDQEIQVACQQACPTGAIEFGNLLSKNSRVVANKKLVRNYEMLAELNLKPRLSYLANVRNPHPALG